MSDSEEEENYCFFGKPLEQYDEDCVPRKRPISVEDQTATDAQGRRRFHGAFTGGFSAGFFNTVGTPQGWTPSEFKSSRQEKAQNVLQKPEDFMDDEDLGEHGIAPQVVRATNDYSTTKKRKKQPFSDGPIPGVPVLHTLLTSGNETIGYLLLKNMGISEKVQKQQFELDTEDNTKVYGCEMPKAYDISKNIESKQYTIPEIYKEYLDNPKSNTFGLGYMGLQKSHIDLFKQSKNFVVKDKNKKLSICGQAFGVGAFEDEDDDIYMKEDMSKYDFELTSEKQAASKPKFSNLIFDVFVRARAPLLNKKLYGPPTIPHSFTGKHKIRKSRFESVVEEDIEKPKERINPAIRARYLGEDLEQDYTESKPVSKCDSNSRMIENTTDNSDSWNAKNITFNASLLGGLDRFVSSSQKEDVSAILEPVTKFEISHGTEQMRDAVKMKMFGPLTRIVSTWHPSPLLCKRFNVPPPFLSEPEKEKKRTKNLIFDQQTHEDIQKNLLPGLSVQKQEDTQTSPNTVESLESSAIKTEDLENTFPVTKDNSLPEEKDLTSYSDQNKTDCQQDNFPKDITEKLDVEKNTDLFKAIFLDSSDSEDEDNTRMEKEEKAEELRTTVLNEPLIPKIKPIKEGILSSVNSHTFSKPTKSVSVEISYPSSSEKELKPDSFEIPDASVYGPEIPQSLTKVRSQSALVESFSESDDEWVEKHSERKKKSKHKKEKKREKDKRKKHKHSKH